MSKRSRMRQHKKAEIISFHYLFRMSQVLIICIYSHLWSFFLKFGFLILSLSGKFWKSIFFPCWNIYSEIFCSISVFLVLCFFFFPSPRALTTSSCGPLWQHGINPQHPHFFHTRTRKHFLKNAEFRHCNATRACTLVKKDTAAARGARGLLSHAAVILCGTTARSLHIRRRTWI